MAERGVTLAHTTILRWVLRYVLMFEKKWNRFTRPVGTSWRVDDKQGKTVGFLLSELEAAKRFFTRAVNRHGAPEKITLDGYAATHTAVPELKQSKILPIDVCVRTSKYLNNLIEQDHRRVKQRVYPMLGFKRFENAAVTISGIELIQRIRKGQFNTSDIDLKEGRRHELWQSVLAA